MPEPEKDVQAYLARIRKTIADSKNLVSQVQLRVAETDRMLERQGLTREQVMAMQFSDAQKRAVDAELKRRGLDPLEWWSEVERPAPEDSSPPLLHQPCGAGHYFLSAFCSKYLPQYYSLFAKALLIPRLCFLSQG